MTVEAVARRTNVPLEVVSAGIAALLQPDPASRSQEEDGRRIVPLDDHRNWGWIIVNYERYRNTKTKEDKRLYDNSRYHKRSKVNKSGKSGKSGNDGIHNGKSEIPLFPLCSSENSEFTHAYASASASEGKESEKNQEPAVCKNGMVNPVVSENEPAYWAERLYSRHPKKKNLPLVQSVVAEMWEARGNGSLQFFREVDAVHELWCKTLDWQKNNGSFAPKLDEWLVDRGWQTRPKTDSREKPYQDNYRDG